MSKFGKGGEKCSWKNRSFMWPVDLTSQFQISYYIIQDFFCEEWYSLWETACGIYILCNARPCSVENTVNNFLAGSFFVAFRFYFQGWINCHLIWRVHNINMPWLFVVIRLSWWRSGSRQPGNEKHEIESTFLQEKQQQQQQQQQQLTCLGDCPSSLPARV